MKRAWAEIERLISARSIHRKGFCITDADPHFIIGQAIDEFSELIESPDDPVEMADLLGILFHYCIKQGWTADALEALMLEKFAVRFSDVKEVAR